MPPIVELSDGSIIDVAQAATSWKPSGDTPYSFAPGVSARDPETTEQLILTKEGSYVLIVYKREGPVEVVRAERLNAVHACRWLLLHNAQPIPEDLAQLAAHLRG